MTVDSHGFPMRDDLDQLQTTKRTAYAGEYLPEGREIFAEAEAAQEGEIEG